MTVKTIRGSKGVYWRCHNECQLCSVIRRQRTPLIVLHLCIVNEMKSESDPILPQNVMPSFLSGVSNENKILSKATKIIFYLTTRKNWTSY